MYTTNLGSNATIIDDRNSHLFVQQVKDGEYASGYVARDYNRNPYGSVAKRFGGDVFPRSQWDDLIKLQEDNESSPWHVWKANGKPILNQASYGYCWMYGTVACIMNRYQAQGVNIPNLCPFFPAYKGKNGRNQGGWAGEALGYIEKYGIPDEGVYTDRDRRALDNPDVKENAKAHGHAEYVELPRNNFDAMCSVLLDPKNPRPVTLALNWWGHLVAGARVVKIDRSRYGVEILNSWTKDWENEGTAVLAETKATAYESIAVERVIPRSQVIAA